MDWPPTAFPQSRACSLDDALRLEVSFPRESLTHFGYDGVGREIALIKLAAFLQVMI